MSDNTDILLIDGKNLAWMSGAVDPESESGMVFRFLRTLLKIHKEIGGEIVVCWEGGPRDTLVRREMLPTYKDRPKDDLQIEIGRMIQAQLPGLQEILSSIGVKQANSEGWEADDTIATLARWADQRGHKAVIYSWDNDLCQCVTERVTLVRKMRDKSGRLIWIDPRAVRIIMGVDPHQIPFLKSLMGDPSDNFPGVHKVGQKLGARLVNHFEVFESFLESAQSNSLPKMEGLGPKIRASIHEAATDSSLETFFQIAQVNTEAPVRFESRTSKALTKLLIGMGLKSFVRQRELSQLRNLA